MDFKFTEEQELWRKTVQKFASQEVTKELLGECDKQKRYPKELYKKAAELGWTGLMIPEEYGGIGGDAIMMAIFIESMAKRGFETCPIFMPLLFIQVILRYGSEEQKKYYGSHVASGDLRLAIAITEPDAGSDAGSLGTSAVIGDDNIIINGQKMFCTGAQTDNTVILVAARTDKSLPKHKGISFFLVPNDTPGIEMRLIPTIAWLGVGNSEIFLTDVTIPRKNLLGDLNDGWRYVRGFFDLEHVYISSACAGLAQGLVEESISYSRDRVQFAQPISKFQAIQFKLTDMAIRAEAARLLVYQTASMVTEGLSCTKEAAIAKAYASEALYYIATEAMQIFGGYSLTTDYDLERHWRVARETTIFGGTSEMQRNIIVSTLNL